MKKLVCEMCGSSNLLKQEGVFVCQSCGTKYSVEEARKMMVEGTVDVSGSTVKVDKTEKLNNLYEIARRSKNDNNSENAAKYYDMILQEDPMSWEASFYTTYYSAMQTNIAGIENAAYKVSNCIDTVLHLIHDNVSSEEQPAAVSEVAARVALIATMLRNASESHFENIDISIKDRYKQEYVDRMFAVRDLLYNTGNHIETIFDNNQPIQKIAVPLWKSGVELHKLFVNQLIEDSANQKIIDHYSSKIGKYDSSFLKQAEAEAKKREIAKIQARIKSIDSTIAGTNTTGSWKPNGIGIFFIIISIIMLILGLFLISLDSTQIWPLFVAGIELAIGIPLLRIGKIKPEQVEKNKKLVANLETEKKQLQEKLQNLKK